MTATDLRPQWKDEAKQLEERIAVLKTKIEAANEIFSNGASPKTAPKLKGLPLFPSLSKTIESIVKDKGERPGLTVDQIISLLHQYGKQGETKKATVYALAKRSAKQGKIIASNVEGQAVFIRS